MNVFAICITVLLINIILLSSPRWAALATIAGVLYLTQQESLIIWNMNLFAIRLIELAGISRVLLRKEIKINNINNLDKYFFLYTIIYLLIYVIRCIFDINSRVLLTYQIGIFVDGMIIYIVFRGLLDSVDKLQIFLSDMVFLLIPFTAFMVIESITGKNVFSYIENVTITPYLRSGYYRSQASFRHAILAGSVGATIFPLFWSIKCAGKNYNISILGIILCVIIVVASNSSGPVMALSVGIISFMFWPFRNKMKNVRWSIIALLLILHIIMKAPVWFLVSRISDVIGGDGWHRANLINKSINSIGEWWLYGMSWVNTEEWAATTMPWGGIDATNEYINIAINGGVIPVILFIILIGKCYKYLGIKMEDARKNEKKYNEIIYWGLGASLTSHVLNFMSVSYWDQFYVIWYMLIAIISGITSEIISSSNDNKLSAS